MRVVHELRRLAAQPHAKGALSKMKTETGIFSLYFASERLLRDVVKV